MSLKGDKYENAEEVKFRLENSVVLYDGRPVFIHKVSVPDIENDKGEIARVFFYELPLVDRGKAQEQRRYLSSKKFDLAPFRMGYMNNKGHASFVARQPIRQNKQGLTSGVCAITDILGHPSMYLNFGEMIRSQGFVDMIDGKYPDFKECGDMLNKKDVSSVAVSRSFAFSIDHDLEALFLLHKGIKCGMSLRGDRGIKLPAKFHFLREEMEEHRIPIL